MAEKKINLEAEKNADSLLLAVSSMERRLAEVYKGGGQKRIDKLHANGKMTARERISKLLDPDKPSIEVGALPDTKCTRNTVAVRQEAWWW